MIVIGPSSFGKWVLWGFLLNGLWLVLVVLHESGEIELWLLEHLNLPDKDVLEWEDLSAFLLNLL